MKKKKRHGFEGLMALFLCTFILIVGLSACEEGDHSSRSGKLRLSLVADTTSLKKGFNSGITKTVSDEFEKFLTTDDYRILIVANKDTVKSYDRFDQMPAEIELPEGTYTLVASKGDNLPVAFENPYFEGTTDFTVKSGMDTPLDVVCSLGNARVMVEYTSDFLEAYDNYTVLLNTPFVSEDFEINKEESRPIFLQVPTEGTDLVVGIRLKKFGEEEEKTYYIPTSLKIGRRQNIHLIFKTDGASISGIGLDVLLDDELEEVSFSTDIPEFMWEVFKKPTLTAMNFESGTLAEESQAGLFKKEIIVGFVMRAGVGSLCIKYWRDDQYEEDAEVLDLATDEGVEKALSRHFSWQSADRQNVNMSGMKNGQLFLLGGINSLESPPKGTNGYLYHFEVSGHNANGDPSYTNVLTFDVFVRPAGMPLITVDPIANTLEIVEGMELESDWQFDFIATGLIDEEETNLTVSDGSSEKKFEFMQDNGGTLALEYGAALAVENAAKMVIKFPKKFAATLAAPETGQTTYRFTFQLKDKKGETYTLERNLIVYAPSFEVKTVQGNAFAKRIVLRAEMPVGDRRNLSFQYRRVGGGDWIPVPGPVKSDGDILYVDTVKGLEPETAYEVQAVYQRIKKAVSLPVVVTTESIGRLPNPQFEEWSIMPDKKGCTEPGLDKEYSGLGGLFQKVEFPYRCWEVWQPWNSELSKGWNTLNISTTSAGDLHDGLTSNSGRKWTRYVANSGTIRTEGVNGGYAALVRTVGYGSGNSAAAIEGNAGTVNLISPGELYLGTYNDGGQYGIPFASRPSGFRFFYKYVRKTSDRFIAEIVVLDRNGNEIAVARLPESEAKATDSWKQANVMLQYNGEYKQEQAASMYIRFVSGSSTSKDDLLIVPPAMNLSNGEYVGSQLYVDNVELIYE